MTQRKYPKSVGERSDFDADGKLKDHKLTYGDALRLIVSLKFVIPELENKSIHLDWSKCNARTRYGSANHSTGVIRLFPMGQQAKTLVHELAHIAVPSEYYPIFGRLWGRRRRWKVAPHGWQFKSMAAKIEKSALSILNLGETDVRVSDSTFGAGTGITVSTGTQSAQTVSN